MQDNIKEMAFKRGAENLLFFTVDGVQHLFIKRGGGATLTSPAQNDKIITGVMVDGSAEYASLARYALTIGISSLDWERVVRRVERDRDLLTVVVFDTRHFALTSHKNDCFPELLGLPRMLEEQFRKVDRRVALIESLIVSAEALASQDLTDPATQAALERLREDPSIAKLLNR